MMGEELNAVDVTESGLWGDRRLAIIDATDGKVVSAKNPRKWPHLFEFRASLIDGVVRITLPDGNVVASNDPAIDEALSGAVGCKVRLAAVDEHAKRSHTAETFWEDVKELRYQNAVTDFEMPRGTFFDSGVLHIISTATLDRLRRLYPQGRFEARRFRPNIVVQTLDATSDFPENEWVGSTISIGDDVELKVTGPCSRCVMTTLPQGDLPRDVGILRAAAQYNNANVGVYASVLRSGKARRLAPVAILGVAAHLPN
jgi:uncharacterized protein